MRIKFQITVIALVLLFVNLSFPVHGQQIIFNKVPPPDGRSFDFVTGITQDVNGFMWFSTKKGLSSFDGNRVTPYKNNPLNPNSLVSNFLETVYADVNGSIWIGSLGYGLDRFDPETGVYTHFTHDPNDPESLSCDTVTAIHRDKQGTLWIGTHGGLDEFDPKTNKFLHYRFNADDSTSISNNQVREIYEDKQGALWFGTGSPYPDNGGGPDAGGLNRMNKNTGTFTRYLHDPNNPKSLLNNKITAIFEDNQGTFWIGTAKNGLHKMNRQEGTFERLIYDPAHPEKLSGPPINPTTTTYEHITFFTQDAAGSYWFGTIDAGLFYFNPKVGKIMNYKRIGNSNDGFSDNGAWTTFTSRDGILWIGATQGNIYRINPLHKEIPHTIISTASVNKFYEEPNGVFWIGTSRDLIRRENGIEKRYQIDSNPLKANDNFIYNVEGDKQGNIWVGSSGGLCLWDRKNEKFIRYKSESGNINSLSSNNVTDIHEDKDGSFWIGTMRGLNLMDRKTGRFTQYIMNPADTLSFGQNLVTTVIEDKSGKMWISTWNRAGVHLFNRENKTFKNYLKGNNMMVMFEDSNGVLLAGGIEGLFRYDQSADVFVRFSVLGSVGEIYNVISIVEDDYKNLWLGTSDGIVRINALRNETSLYGINYGVGNSLSYGSAYKRQNGELYFGDATGYFSFSPTELTQNLRVPEIVFTGFSLSDQKVLPGNGGPVIGSLSDIKEIRLRYDQNVFSLGFTVIDYANPLENRLIYSLENYDNSWHEPNSERKVYYFNIPPGKYVFHVKAVNSYGLWSEKKFDIIILPPWWRTWWAYCMYGLLFIAAVFGFDRFMRQRLLSAEKERNRERELAQAKEIEKAYTELKATQSQLIQSEKMASLGELTAGIAHEIQNPLNFVNNFSEVNQELLLEMNEEIEKGNLDEVKLLVKDVIENEQKINHHGKRADAIVKGMLQHSRTSSGVKEPTDINALADEYLRLAYHGLRAKDKSFNATMKTDFDESIGKINVIPQDIGRVILNLITNAFYAVDEKKHQASPPSRNEFGTGSEVGIGNLQKQYEPTVTVKTSFRPLSGGQRGAALISVKDNGNGIPKAALEKIFQPFFTTKPTGQGTGLGLSLSYEIVTKGHGGELKVDTVEARPDDPVGRGSGTEFTIILPL